ncbi:protein-glutamate methylesterase/protein-glutamine glutaminase [Cognaticolwellia mytili]|uniref:protein-glutamate methylesterase/protein-glutamine glutaminase n=1 Tax=Cognaticolwellia mytili TaxID=1888913 RepID=UPI000A16CE77|nr:chemotaxis response regulator protein-glutamate methylesterase [Cognaticolwellia mytili]
MEKITVLIIDDSSVIRNIVKELLSDIDDIEVVGEAKDPLVARELIKQLNPDVLTLDVEMPKMDGITFLSNLMRLRPMPVVMLSTLTTKGADTTLKALELGAIDFIAKPSFEALVRQKGSFKDSIVEKIRYAASINVQNLTFSRQVFVQEKPKKLLFNGSCSSNHLIAVGASTGGTDAIKKLLMCMPANAPAIVITLHIPCVFSTRFAERMNKNSLMTVREAKHGEEVKSGHVYIAPGDKHLKVESKAGVLSCILEDSPEVNRHKPAVDVLFNSLKPIANNVQAVILTGMGDDGAQGLLALKSHGAMTIIQDKNTSLVWGMPGSAFKLEAHQKQLPISSIASELLQNASLGWCNKKERYDENI